MKKFLLPLLIPLFFLTFSAGIYAAGGYVKKIKLADGDHDIDCKIDGIGSMGLKSQFVKKV